MEIVSTKIEFLFFKFHIFSKSPCIFISRISEVFWKIFLDSKPSETEKINFTLFLLNRFLKLRA